MITAAQASEILKQYTKHGWTLRRVLLSDATRASFSSALESVFGDAAVESSEIDAAWFSRPSAGGGEAWELRRLRRGRSARRSQTGNRKTNGKWKTENAKLGENFSQVLLG